MNALFIGLLADSLLCLFTAWGLRHGRRWSLWTAIIASAVLLPAYPWLTIAGAIGLVGLLAAPPELESREEATSKADIWASKRRRGSLGQQILLSVCWLLVLVVFGWLRLYARRIGLPEWRPGMTYWIYLSIFLLIHVSFHELGHAIVAWGFHYKIRAFSVGPFTLWNGPDGRQFRIDWKRLLSAGGYMGAVPTSSRNLRFRQIAIVAAGPAASLLSGQVLMAMFLMAPGTPLQDYWWVLAFNAVIALNTGLVNLIPLGYSDGSMLFHLVLGTEAGRQLLDNVLSQIDDESSAYKGRADFDKAVELRQDTLHKAQSQGSNRLAVAISHQKLGHALMAVDDWPGAEREFRKCLEFQAECAGNPGLRANVWSGLYKVCVMRGHGSDAAGVYASAAAAIQPRIQENSSAVSRTMMAQVHLYAGNFNDSLAESAAALESLRKQREQAMLRVTLHSAQAQAAVGLGWVDSGLSAAKRAVEIASSGKLPAEQQNLAWDEIADLGERLSWAGQAAAGAELLREGAGHLASGGAAATAARYRIKLAAALRRAGRPQEGLELLSAGDDLPPPARRSLLHERARTRLAAGSPAEAMADCRELLALWRSEAEPPAPEMAVVENLLACACLAAGEPAEAETLARQAGEVLAPWQHPDAGSCRITEALAHWSGTHEWKSALLSEGMRLIQDCPLLGPREKARSLEAEADRAERHERRDDARSLRRASAAQDRLVGMNLIVTSPAATQTAASA